MSAGVATLASVNVGMPREVRWQGRTVFTGIWKEAVQGSRLVHFIGMAAIVAFIVVHVALALIVPKTIGAMITGGPVVDDEAR